MKMKNTKACIYLTQEEVQTLIWLFQIITMPDYEDIIESVRTKLFNARNSLIRLDKVSKKQQTKEKNDGKA